MKASTNHRLQDQSEVVESIEEEVKISASSKTVASDSCRKKISPTKNGGVSEHLQAEYKRLSMLLVEIKNSGEVAPTAVWISPNFQTKNGKTYEYYKLTSANPNVRNQGLGKAGSSKYRDWVARIARRNAITELEQQLSLLQGLIDRQRNTMISW